MTKDTIIANTFSAGALATFLMNVETAVTLLVLCTALFINVRKIYKDYKRGE